ncbi:MAG: hypothetical protein WD184_06390 [Acidimicrobiia bacterium]
MALLLGIPTAFGAGVGAHPSIEDHDEDELSLTEAEALDFDAAYIAEKFDMPFEVVRQQLDYQIAFGDLLDRIPQDIQQSQFAGAALDRFNPGTATIFFKDEVPSEVVSLVGGAGVPGIQLQGGMRYSNEDLKTLSRAVVATVTGLGYSHLVLSIEPGTQRLALVVVDPPGPSFTTASELAEAIAIRLDEAFQVDARDLIVEIRPEGATLGRATGAYGGSKMPVAGDPVAYCTSAFVVRKNSNGAEGVLTASHCEGLTTMYHHNLDGTIKHGPFSTPWGGGTLESGDEEYGDIEWRTTVHDALPKFHWRDGDARRTVGSRASNLQHPIDQLVCRYGRTTDYECAYISHNPASFSISWLGDIVVLEDMVLLSNGCFSGFCASQDGDSGGPWFNGSKAFGIHHGWLPVAGGGGEAFEAYSKIQNAEILFDLSVQTG